MTAARKAFPGWSGATAYNRGQVIYRVAELLEGRRAQFVEEVAASEGITARKARAVVDASIDRLVWYAGWADKVAQVLGGANSVSGPYFDFSIPEPTGVVAIVAPQRSSLLGLVSTVAPAITTGNTVRRHRLAERRRCRRSPSPRCSRPPTSRAVSSTSSPARSTRWRRGSHPHGRQRHRPDRRRACSRPSSRSRRQTTSSGSYARRSDPDVDWTAAPGMSRLRAFLETKTVWHPIGV